MKSFIIILILSLIFISGCTDKSLRFVYDCRQCNTNEFCERNTENALGHKGLISCIKYGNRTEVRSQECLNKTYFKYSSEKVIITPLEEKK